MLRESRRFHVAMRQDQFDHLCEIAREKIQADRTDKTSVNSLIVDAIDLFLACADYAKAQEEQMDVPAEGESSGSGACRDEEVSYDHDGAFYRYGGDD